MANTGLDTVSIGSAGSRGWELGGGWRSRGGMEMCGGHTTQLGKGTNDKFLFLLKSR